jgi:hypothetical protein
MGTRLTLFVILAGGLSLQSGCVVFEAAQKMTRESFRSLKPRPTDHRDPTEEANHEWDYVGNEARGNRPREQDPDRWYKKYVQSEKARSIERNLGID